MDIYSEHVVLSIMIFALAYVHKKIENSSVRKRPENKEKNIESIYLNEANGTTRESLNMNTISYLKQITGNEKTLIISCIECCMDVENSGSNQFYRHTTLGNVVCENSFQEDSIKYYVESRKCTHIIVAGHTDCKAIKSILNDSLNSQSIAFLKTELQGMLEGNHSKYLKTDFHELLVIELSVTKLCRSLLKYSFIHERLQREKISVTGIVLNSLGSNKKIFHNGIAFNDLISIN